MTQCLPNPITHPRDLISYGYQHPVQVLAEGPALLTAARRVRDRHSESVLLTALAGANLYLSQLDAARDLYAQALATARGDVEGEARVLTYRLLLYVHANETSTLEHDAARLQATWSSLRMVREQVAALNILAGVTHRQRQTEASRAWLIQAYELALQSGEAEAASQAASNLGTSFTHSREYGAAIAWVHRALQQNPQQAETLRPQQVMLYCDLRQYDRALALIAAHPLPLTLSHHSMWINKSYCLSCLGQFDEALTVIEALLPFGDTTIPKHQVTALENMGMALLGLGRPDEARQALTQSAALVETLGEVEGATPLLRLAELELPQAPELAYQHASRARDLASAALGQDDVRAWALRLMAQACAAQGDHAQAYTHAEEARVLQTAFDQRLEQQRLEAAFAELEYDRAQAMARLQHEALQQARAEVAELQDHLEARVAQRTTELQAANEELRAFARSVSHYLRTPLQLLMGHAALLDTASEQTRGTHTQAIMNTTDRMADILSGLLQYGERQAGPLTLEQVDLAEVLELSWQDLGGPAPTVKLELGPLPTVRGDYTALRLVFGNLLHNAVKYTQGRPDPRVQVRATRNQNMHLIEVRDNGMGFQPADAERLFRLFSRLPEAQAFDGLGVGLADVWRIVIAHGGHVWAEGRPGEGATFTVSLPADEA